MKEVNPLRRFEGNKNEATVQWLSKAKQNRKNELLLGIDSQRIGRSSSTAMALGVKEIRDTTKAQRRDTAPEDSEAVQLQEWLS